MRRYIPKDIETKWQQTWDEQGIYRATEDPSKPKRYVLEYFPYPSGAAMHVGHVRNYTIGDAISRFMRMQGYNVLHPMGWDAFGLPAENYAIKTGVSPQQVIADATSKFKRQLTQMGFGYDWSREVNSSDPNYYKWTQWLFLLLFRRGLAYQQESLQWWCPVDKTVLANEQVENGKCWRCGSEVEKKALKQWFFKITDYADRLAKDLDDVDWSDGIKQMQRNWIGRSKGAEVDFKVDGTEETIRIFTTRPDTLYGATFMVVAPEHPLVDVITTESQKEKVGVYKKTTLGRSNIERQETDREKTGVFTGAYATNPVSDEKIPIWIADYVLFGYGTGAIMAVPGHDQRDYDFAKKFDLPIVEIIEATTFDKENPPQEGKENTQRDVVICVIKNQEGKYLTLKWNKLPWQNFVMGGVDAGEDRIEAARREIEEETGFIDLEYMGRMPFALNSVFYAAHKDVNRDIRVDVLRFELKSDKQGARKLEKHEDFELVWIDQDDLPKLKPVGGLEYIVRWVTEGDFVYTGEGRIINSAAYDDLPSEEMREKIVNDLAAKGVATERINYKMRDWLISRQRYWGAPIPIIHCSKDGAVPVPDDQLPVVLPEVESYEPSGDGRSPLANVSDFVHTTCPKCGSPAQRETDTMDGFACSSWYFLRFADPHNDAKAFDDDKVKFWLPVDDYIGGAEHAVMHLLYARFWTKVMYDERLIDFQEPFKTLRNQGMILAPDGQKMSKSKGNTIEPDGLIEQGYGADSIRIMELFIGPWNQMANWSVEGMGGSHRFLQRVWTLCQEHLEASGNNVGQTSNDQVNRAVHRATKRVTEDLHELGFNTAIAALMELTNELYKLKTSVPLGSNTWQTAISTFLQLLAPFAPHIAEELWQQLGHEESIHVSEWPTWDEKLLTASTINIVVQVNGKVRGEVEVPIDANEDAVVAAAKAHDKVASYLTGDIKKSIYVPKKLLNFVVG